MPTILDDPVEIYSRIESPSKLVTTVGVAEDSTLTLLNTDSLNCVLEVQNFNSSLVVGQGPSGANAEEIMKYAERNDFVGNDVIYHGDAIPGSLDTDPVWRICKITFIGADSIKEWANGNADFANMWSSHLTLDYI